MDSNGEECSNKPGTSRENEEQMDEDSSNSLEKQAEELNKSILSVSDKYDLNAHATKGLIHHICKDKNFLGVAFEKIGMAFGKGDVNLPIIKVTRSMAKKKNLGGLSGTDPPIEKESPEPNQLQEEGIAPAPESCEDVDEGETETEEESVLEQDTEEDEPLEDLFGDDVCQNGWNERPKSVNLNDSAIYDDLQDTHCDLFRDFRDCNFDFEEEEEDDTDYYPPPREYNEDRQAEMYHEYFLHNTFYEEEEEEEDDPDYIIPMDKAVGSDSESDGDGGRRRRCRRTEIEISRKEYELLMKERDADKALEPTETQRERRRLKEYRKAAIEYRKSNKRPIRSRNLMKSTFEVSDDYSCSLLLDGLVTFRQCEINQLYIQLEQHIQLCVQGLAQCKDIPYLLRDRNSYQKMINEFEANYQEFGVADPDSFFNIPNLPYAIDDCYEMQNIELISKEFAEWASSPTKIPHSFMPHPETCLLLSRSRALLYPELVPYTQGHRIPVDCYRFAKFSVVDDTLLLLGLLQFGHVPSCTHIFHEGRSYLIMKHLLPVRPKKQVRERLASIRKYVCPNVLHQLIMRAEEENPAVVFTPAFTFRLEGVTMVQWPREVQPCWYEAFTKWFSVEDHRFIHFTGESDPVEKPARKGRRRSKAKNIEKDESFGKANYENVLKYLGDLRPIPAEEANQEGETESQGNKDGEEIRQDLPMAYGVDDYVDMPSFEGTARPIKCGSSMTVPKKDGDTLENAVEAVEMGEEEERMKEQMQENENSKDLFPNSSAKKRAKKVVFLPLSPRNQPDDDEKPIEASTTTENSGAVEISHNAREDANFNMTRTSSRRKQPAPMKKSPISRKDLRKQKKAEEIKKKTMSPATKKLMEDLELSDSDEENTKTIPGTQNQQPNENQPPVYDFIDATTDQPSYVLPEAATTSEFAISRSNSSFIPATPHHHTPSSDVSLSPGLGFMQSPSPTFEGSQLPAPRTPRDDAMTRSPTLLRNMNMSSSLSFSYGTTPTPSARRRLRNMGPTDFSSIEDNGGEEPLSEPHEMSKSPEPEPSTSADPYPESVCDLKPSVSSSSSPHEKQPIGQRKWRKRGREEIMKDGLEAMLDPTYRARQEATISRHIFTDVKRRLSMHRDVLQKIEGIMVSDKGATEILIDLEALLYQAHPDVLYLMSLMFDDIDVPPNLFSDPSRKAYRSAMDMILNIDSYCSRVKYKTSARNIFRILKTKCSEETSQEDFVAEMKQFFGNDRPLWDVLKYHMPGIYNDTPTEQDFEYVDMRLMNEDLDAAEYEHVEAGRVLEAVVNKRRNKFHVQHDKLFVNHGSGYVHAITYKKPPFVPIPDPPAVSSSPVLSKPPRKRKAANPKKSPVGSKAPPPPIPQPRNRPPPPPIPQPRNPPPPPQWTKEFDISILTAYNDISDDDEEAVVTALIPKIPFSRDQISARLKFLLDQFNQC